MKTNACYVVFIFLFLCLIVPGSGQTVSTLWSHTYGEFAWGGFDHKAELVRFTNDGGYLLSGTRLIKTNHNGISQHDEERFGSVAQPTDDGGYVTTEYRNSDTHLIKLDSNFNQQWDLNISNTQELLAVNCIIKGQNGGYILCGKTNDSRAWWGKVDDLGNLVWSCDYILDSDGEMYCIRPTMDGGYIMSGNLQNRPILVKIVDSGGIQSVRSYPYHLVDASVTVVQNADQTFTCCFTEENPDTRQRFISLIFTDHEGLVSNKQTFFGDNWDGFYCKDMTHTQDGGYIIAGFRILALYPNMRALVIRTDSLGTELWRQEYKGNGDDSKANHILTLDANTYVFCGTDIENYEDGMEGSQPWLVKIREYMVQDVDFAAFPLSGAVPFTVQFNDQSLGTPLQRSWDFGDGESANGNNPVHIYREPGLYTVRLTLTDGSQNYVKVKANYILATPSGTVTYDVYPRKISIDGDLSDWQEVSHLSTTDNPDNSYPQSDLTATASMAWNGRDTWYMAFDVQDNFIAHNTEYTSFADDPQNGSYGISRYWWNDCIEAIFAKDAGGDYFDAFKIVFAPDELDRTLYQSNHVAGHTWLTWGELNPLTAPDGDRSPKVPPVCSTAVVQQGNHWYGEAALSIHNPPPPDSLYRFIFSFNDVDDNEGATSRHHINTIGGDVDVWDALAQLFGSMPILNFIPDQLHAGFTADTTQGYRPLTVQFTPECSGLIDTWLWDFGDGETSAETEPEHTYESTGIFTVSLVVSGPAGADTLVWTDYITVLENHPVADFTADPVSGNVPLEVSFTDMSVGVIDSWAWDFGDGTSSDVQNPVHTFTTADSFTITLQVTGPGGSRSKTREHYIHVDFPLDVDDDSKVPEEFCLYQNYPNPFNHNTCITFDLPRAGLVRLSLYNINGEFLTNLLNREQQAGTYHINWDASGVASGIYFAVLQTRDDFRKIKLVFLQ